MSSAEMLFTKWSLLYKLSLKLVGKMSELSFTWKFFSIIQKPVLPLLLPNNDPDLIPHLQKVGPK